MSRKLLNKIENLFCDEEKSDMKFLIENENTEYPAHKFIIGLGSNVLHNMVYGNDTTLSASTIIVPNFSSKDFLPVLKYLYTYDLEWNFDDFDGVLAVGRYFGLIELESLFNTWVADKVTYKNVLDIYARFHDRNDIVGRTSMKIIQLTISYFFMSDDDMLKFFGLPMEGLSQILQMDELCIINEEQLFQQMLFWLKKTTMDRKNASLVFGNLVKLIRFADMKIHDYREFEGILLAKTNCRWKIRVINKSKVIADTEGKNDKSQRTIGDAFEVIRITARNRTIRIFGLCTLSMEAVYVENNNNFESIQCYRSLDPYSTTMSERYFDVMFENSIEIAKNTSIRLKVPVCSLRFVLEETDLFLVEGIHNGNVVDNLPIAQIFVSMR